MKPAPADGYRYLLAAALRPLGVKPEHDWRFYARCKDMDPELSRGAP